MGKNGGQKSLLAEIVGFGIDNLGSSERDTLKKILDETYTIDERKQTLLEYYNQRSKDSKEIKAETLNKLQNFLGVGPKDKPKNMKEELEKRLINFQEVVHKHPDQPICFALFFCSGALNGGQQSLLAEIVDFEIDNLGSSGQKALKNILNTARINNGQTLLDYYSKKSTDSREIKEKTLNKLQNFLGVGPREQPLTRRGVLPGLNMVSEVNGSDSLRRPKACGNPGLETVSEVNGSDDTVKTPKDINKAPQESDTQTINKGNGDRSVG